MPEARAESIVAALERDDLGRLLHQEVNRLPAKYRAAVILCYFEGRTHDEAAAVLRRPVGTVRSCPGFRRLQLAARPPSRRGCGRGTDGRRVAANAGGSGRGFRHF